MRYDGRFSERVELCLIVIVILPVGMFNYEKLKKFPKVTLINLQLKTKPCKIVSFSIVLFV